MAGFPFLPVVLLAAVAVGASSMKSKPKGAKKPAPGPLPEPPPPQTAEEVVLAEMAQVDVWDLYPPDPFMRTCLDSFGMGWAPFSEGNSNLAPELASEARVFMESARSPGLGQSMEMEYLADLAANHFFPGCDPLALDEYVYNYSASYFHSPFSEEGLARYNEVLHAFLELANETILYSIPQGGTTPPGAADSEPYWSGPAETPDGVAIQVGDQLGVWRVMGVNTYRGFSYVLIESQSAQPDWGISAGDHAFMVMIKPGEIEDGFERFYPDYNAAAQGVQDTIDEMYDELVAFSQCPNGYYYDYDNDVCCPEGFVWSGTSCVPMGYGGAKRPHLVNRIAFGGQVQ